MRLFRDSLTFLALLVIIALIAVMVAPRFVDWKEHQAQVAAFISRQIGVDVRITGALRLSAFPQTELEATGVEIGAVGAPVMRVGSIQLSLAPTALLRGRVQLTLVSLREVAVDLAALDSFLAQRESGGSARIAPFSSRLAHLGVDRLEVKALSILRGAESALFPNPIDLVLEAPDMRGPYRLNVQDFAHARDLRAQIGRFEANGQAKLKGVLEDATFGARMVLDGQIALPGMAEAGLALFDGAIQFNGNPLLPLREGGQQVAFDGSARLRIEPSQIIMDPINLHLGGGEGAPNLEGRGFIDLAPKRPQLQLKLAARALEPALLLPEQPNDRERQHKPTFLALLAGLEQNISTLDPGFDSTITLSIGKFTLSSGTIQDVEAQFAITAEGNRIDALRMALPGQTSLTFTRDAAAAPATLLEGDLRVQSAAPAGFFAFMKQSTEEMPGLPQDMAISTRLRSHKGGLAFTDLVLTSAAGRMQGEGEVRAPDTGKNTSQNNVPHLRLALNAERMDARLLGAFATPPAGTIEAAPLTLSIQLEVASLLLDNRVVGGVVLAFEQEEGGTARLNRFRLTGRGGEELAISGFVSAQETRLTGKLDADKLDELARILTALAPGEASEAVMRRASALSPARALVQLAVEPQGANGSAYTIGVDGALGGTRITVKNRITMLPSGLGVMLDGVLENPDGGRLLAQLAGSPLLPAMREAGRITLKAEGDPRRVLITEIAGQLAGITTDFSGTFVPFRLPFMLEGRAKFTSADLSILHQVLGDGVPYSPKGTPLTAEARLLGERWKITLTALNAQMGDMPIVGEIAFDLARAGQVAGQLKLKDVALYRLLAPAFGLETPLERVEPQGKPMPSPKPPLLTGDLWIEAEKASLAPGLELGATQFVLRFAPSEIAFEGFEAALGAAHYAGALNLRRKGAEVAATGRITFLRAPLPGGLHARMSGEIPFSASGSTHLAFLSSLAGAGQISLEGVSLPNADPMALSRLLSQPVERLGALDENNIGAQLVRELNKASLPLPALTLPLTLVAGQMRLGNAPLDPALLPAEWPVLTPSLTLDVPRGQFDARLVMRQKTNPLGWRGSVPELGLNWVGRWHSITASPVQRQVQVASLVNGLLAGAIQRDLERTEAFEADVRERAFFLRRQKGDAFIVRRNSEIAAFLKAEAEKAKTPEAPPPIVETPPAEAN